MTVRRLAAKPEIRALLNHDRAWALYALADLDDALFGDCEWFACGATGLALVYHGISIRPIFVTGTAPEVRALLEALPAASGYLNLREHVLPCAKGVYAYRERHQMHRMILGDFRPRASGAVPLTPSDAPELQALFDAGQGSGIAFAPFQMETGLFRGLRNERGDLIAAAGIHVYSPAESVAGVGNVFVRQDHRGRGYAQQVLSATVTAVRAAGIQTIGLNVEHSNAAAIHAYENLGFATAFQYYEGPAERLNPTTG